ncbi:MAG: rhodanese-like domain-containing protein [Vagococcus sp.]
MFLFKKVPSISAQELEQLLTKPIELIDVRSPMEFSGGHIPKAKNVPLDRIQTYKPKGKVYVVCQSGPRSKRAVQYLTSQGVDAYNIEGGMMRWTGKVKMGAK